MARRPLRGESGFSLAELVVVMAVIGIVTVLAVPMMLSYWRTSTLLAGARELATALNGARELAIRENRNVCVTTDGTLADPSPRLQYLLGTCTGTPKLGPMTDGAGNIRLVNRVTLIGTADNVIFNYLGAATQKGCYTVVSPSGASAGTLNVSVAQNGRVSVMSVGVPCP
jgi:prepilin-type N-terminal cleavage/methylation domain-containing protein